MRTGRDELEELTRADLVQRAKSLGVDRADVLTRPELIDEIVSATVSDEQERTIARGLLGRARDLVARVMEKGLHLPDAAQRIRPATPTLEPSTPEPRFPAPIPTVALAQVYAKQGHRAQARRVVEEILEADPGNAAAAAFRDELDGKLDSVGGDSGGGDSGGGDSGGGDIAPKAEPPTQAAPAIARTSPEVPTQDSMAVVRSDGRIHVTWRLRPATFARVRARVPAGRLVLRLIHTLASDDGPELRTDDRELDRLAGTADFVVPTEVLSCHAALGWRDGSTFRVLVTETR